jgi:hypothetical protein
MGHSRDISRGLDFFDPLERSLEMAHYVVFARKKNNVPHFQNQRCIITINVPVDMRWDVWIWIGGNP